MGNIVPFLPQRAGSRGKPVYKADPASIIIFPGVRYEIKALPADKSQETGGGKTVSTPPLNS
ncbi:hypothetical protein QBK99_10060 [Corticibacterium sp. UT-5YL-CI-8]|nr:hypothetical protein [Tianweitania sp. UT-5YL-CI-8]